MYFLQWIYLQCKVWTQFLECSELISFLKWYMNGHLRRLRLVYDCSYVFTTYGISNVCSKVNVVVKDYWLSCCIFNNTKPHLIISLPYVNIRLYPVLEISFYPHYAMGACQEGHIALAQMLVRLYSDHWHFVWFIVLMCVNLS